MVNTEKLSLAFSVSLYFIVPKDYMAVFLVLLQQYLVLVNIRKTIVLKAHTCTYKSRFKNRLSYTVKTKLPRNVVKQHAPVV